MWKERLGFYQHRKEIPTQPGVSQICWWNPTVKSALNQEHRNQARMNQYLSNTLFQWRKVSMYVFECEHIHYLIHLKTTYGYLKLINFTFMSDNLWKI